MTLKEESNTALAVMKASTKGSARALAIGVVPILQFGLIVAIGLLIVALPMKLIRKGEL